MEKEKKKKLIKSQKKVKLPGETKYDPTKLEDSVSQVLQRFEHGCECHDDRCFKGLNPEVIYRHRLNIAELTKAEHDMYLMGVTMACLTDPNQTAKNTERRRLRAQYVYQGRRVCLDAFLYLENCTHYQIKRIRKHLITHGVTPRVHGNHGKIPHNTFSLDIYQIATEYLKIFINKQEKKLKIKTGKNTPLHLSSEITKKTVHNYYKDYAKNKSPTTKVLGYSTFCKFMKVQFPQVKFAKIEFVVRTGQGQKNNDNINYGDCEEESSEIGCVVDDNSDELMPIVLTEAIEQDNNAYFITSVDKIQEGLSYQVTTDGIILNKCGLPVTVANITSI